MAAIQDRTAAELKAELAAAIERSRALLGQSTARSDHGVSTVDDPTDRLTGLELTFDELRPEPAPRGIGEADVASLSDEELDAILRETEPPGDQTPDIVTQLKGQIAQNPLPWAIGALVLGTVGTRMLFGEDSPLQTKNPRQNASQRAESAITHGSLLGQIMKIGFEVTKPALLEATKGWLTRIVDKKR